MSYRITQRDLEGLVRRLNTIKGYGTYPKYSTIGAYCLDGAYGGVSLHRYVNEAGGVSDVFRCGYVTKRDLYNRISAYLDGMGAK